MRLLLVGWFLLFIFTLSLGNSEENEDSFSREKRSYEDDDEDLDLDEDEDEEEDYEDEDYDEDVDYDEDGEDFDEDEEDYDEDEDEYEDDEEEFKRRKRAITPAQEAFLATMQGKWKEFYRQAFEMQAKKQPTPRYYKPLPTKPTPTKPPADWWQLTVDKFRMNPQTFWDGYLKMYPEDTDKALARSGKGDPRELKHYGLIMEGEKNYDANANVMIS